MNKPKLTEAEARAMIAGYNIGLQDIILQTRCVYWAFAGIIKIQWANPG